MAALATTVTGFGETANSRTYFYSGHTASNPKLIIQKRKVATAVDGQYETSIQVVSGTVNAASELLAKKVVFEIKMYGPADGTSAAVTAALAIIRDVVQSTEYTSVVSSQEWLKG